MMISSNPCHKRCFLHSPRYNRTARMKKLVTADSNSCCPTWCNISSVPSSPCVSEPVVTEQVVLVSIPYPSFCSHIITSIINNQLRWHQYLQNLSSAALLHLPYAKSSHKITSNLPPCVCV